MTGPFPAHKVTILPRECGLKVRATCWLVPERPTRDDAAAALALIRSVFATFCFADAETISGVGSEPDLVDIHRPPGMDESSFLAALMTAVCRPSLDLAPGVLLRAPPLSGAGAGKGLLARCICIIAFGREPHAVTARANTEEVEKRIAAELIEGSPALFLDNLNNITFKSDLLASVMTERPARVRLLGRSQMATLNTSAFVVLTRATAYRYRRTWRAALLPLTSMPERRTRKSGGSRATFVMKSGCGARSSWSPSLQSGGGAGSPQT